VDLNQSFIPDEVSLPVKITIYRLVQESLHNAYRHAGGLGQKVSVTCLNSQITIEVSDRGPGFNQEHSGRWDEHLGLVGMRERVESLGGNFRVESVIGEGTRVIANLFLQRGDEHEEGQ
jgi:signal transduction histidine kinase